MALSNPNHFPKTPLPNTIPSGVRASTYELGGGYKDSVCNMLSPPHPEVSTREGRRRRRKGRAGGPLLGLPLRCQQYGRAFLHVHRAPTIPPDRASALLPSSTSPSPTPPNASPGRSGQDQEGPPPAPRPDLTSPSQGVSLLPDTHRGGLTAGSGTTRAPPPLSRATLLHEAVHGGTAPNQADHKPRTGPRGLAHETWMPVGREVTRSPHPSGWTSHTSFCHLETLHVGFTAHSPGMGSSLGRPPPPPRQACGHSAHPLRGQLPWPERRGVALWPSACEGARATPA